MTNHKIQVRNRYWSVFKYTVRVMWKMCVNLRPTKGEKSEKVWAWLEIMQVCAWLVCEAEDKWADNCCILSSFSFFLQFVGSPCGHHGNYTFYKAFKYTLHGKQRILSLGEFFFVKIWEEEDIVSVGEAQLLWEDRSSGQILVSLRIYFLPENTPDGRCEEHGEVSVILARATFDRPTTYDARTRSFYP